MDIDPIADMADQSFTGYICNTNTICCSVLQLTNKKAAITIIAEMSFFCKFQNFYSLTRNELKFELLHEHDGFNMYFRLLALEDVKITYENNDFVNYVDQFYLKTLYSFNVFMASSTFLSSYCRKMF
jgi:hypothetical protein